MKLRIWLLSITFFLSAHAQQPIHTEHQETLFKMYNGFLLSRALHVFAELRIADHLASKPRVIDAEFAMLLGANQEMVYRLLRMLAGHGIVHEDDQGKFSLTELGKYLRSDHPDTLANLFRKEDATRWCSYGHLTETVKTGTPAFDLVYKQPYFDFIKEDPMLQERFNRGMRDISSQEDRVIAQALSFDMPVSIVDIGGGTGNLLITLKNTQGSTLEKAYLFDYTSLSVEHCRKLEKQGILFTQGSFFEYDAIPHDKDVYVLKRILHDWDKEHCIKILTSCKQAMSASSVLYIIDAVIPTGNDYHMSKDVDLVMMTLFGGKERNQADFEEIVNAVGMHIVRYIPLPSSMLTLIEVKI